MITVNYEDFAGKLARINASGRPLDVRPIQVARASATLCGVAPGLGPGARLAKLALVGLETLLHLRLARPGGVANPVLQAVGLDGAPTRKAIVENLGVGLARVAIERPPLEIVDVFNLDALLAEMATPTLKRLDGRRQPDLVGSDVHGNWVVLEAKGRSQATISAAERSAFKRQARAIALVDMLDREIPLAPRLVSAAAFGAQPILLYVQDPEAVKPPVRRYQVDPEALLWSYYQPARDVAEAHGVSRLRGISGAPGYVAAPLVVEGMSLVVHRRILETADDPDGLIATRLELHEEWLSLQEDESLAEDVELSLGLDGFGLAVEGPGSALVGLG